MSESFINLLPGIIIKILRKIRDIIFILLEPFDYCCRLINGKKDFPPLYLRRYIGPLKTFEMSGSEFLVYLKIITGFLPDERILDIGCGCGVIAIFLNEFTGFSGKYYGVDIHRSSINWCKKNINSKNSKFKFSHIDVRNEQYNPKGKQSPKEYKFPFENSCFDVILLKSVFTHMLPEEVENYFREIARLLSPGGRCLATFFLLNEKQKEFENKGMNKNSFVFGNDICWYAYKNSPESAVAYNENFIMDILKQNGLALKQPVMYGWWSGREDGISFQDMVLIGK